ncbi:MAG: serine hydrolase domain-containing protein [Pseudomonadota bacterium]
MAVSKALALRIAGHLFALAVALQMLFGAALTHAEDTAATQETDQTLVDFIDKRLAEYMEDENAIGVTLALVKDGEIILKKGYGFADKASETPVDPDYHLFRLGSITKVFTSIAIMQLAELGRLDIDSDVNTYLDAFKIPDAFDGPVTIRSLLSHRPGFEDWSNFGYAGSPGEVGELADNLKNSIPARVRPAGVASSYSNWGFGLLGYVVETVSGKPWETYLEEEVFAPLCMRSSTVRQPLGDSYPLNLQPELAERMATIYLVEGDGHREWRYELSLRPPAGTITSSATDMAVFMRTLLAGGTGACGQVLTESTLATMWSRAYPGRPGDDYGLGFRMTMLGDHLAVGHGGAIGNQKAQFLIVPDANMGIIMATNGGLAGQYGPARDILSYMLGDAEPVMKPTIDLEPGAIDGYAGRYLSTRRTYSDARKLFGLLNNPVLISAEGPSSVRLQGNSEEHNGVYRAIAGNGFQNVDTGRIISFDMDGNGEAQRLNMGNGSTALARLDLLEDRRLMAVFLVAAVLFSLLRILAPLYRKLRRRASTSATLAYDSVSLISACLVLAALGSLILTAISATELGRDLWYSWPPPWFTTMLTAILLLALSTAAQTITLPALLTSGETGMTRRVTAVLFTACLLVLVFLLHTYNLVGYRV